jgi:hypothetical protein
VCDAQALTLRAQHGDELATAQQLGLQATLLGIGERFDEAREILACGQQLGEPGQDAGVDGVGLGEQAEGFGKVAGLARVDDGHRQAGGLQRRGDGGFVATGGLQHDQRYRLRDESLHEAFVALEVIAEPFDRSLRRHADVEEIFRDVDADGHGGRVLHGPSL